VFHPFILSSPINEVKLHYLLILDFLFFPSLSQYFVALFLKFLIFLRLRLKTKIIIFFWHYFSFFFLFFLKFSMHHFPTSVLPQKNQFLQLESFRFSENTMASSSNLKHRQALKQHQLRYFQ